MENLFLFIKNLDVIFTVNYEELGIEHLLLGLRYWDGTLTVRYKELVSILTFRYKEIGWNI